MKDRVEKMTVLFCSGLEGNQAAYAAFLKDITSLLRQMVGSRVPAADREDVIQEILISIHKARHTYDGKRPMMPWISSIARFRTTDYLRRHYAQRNHQMVDIEPLKEVLPDVTKGADDHESIGAWLENVPEKQKQILTMMHVEGYTAKEVGNRLSMNESAVKVAAHRAIKKIRETFTR